MRLLQLEGELETWGGSGKGEKAADEPGRRIVRSIPFDEYQQITRKLVVHLLEGDAEGKSKTDLANWYLESKAFDSEEELVQEALVVRSVIDRMIMHDQVLVVVNEGEGERERGRERDCS